MFRQRQPDRPDARVHFSVAVGAEHHALGELSEDLLPATRDPILRDTELFLGRIAVMELEDRLCPGTSATFAHAAHERHRSSFLSPTEFDDRAALRVDILSGVTQSMAVGAEEITLRGFADQHVPLTAEVAQCEFLCAGITVMEVQGNPAYRIPAVFTATPMSLHEQFLELPAPFLLIAVRLRVPPPATVFPKVVSREGSGRHLRAVVDAEW